MRRWVAALLLIVVSWAHGAATLPVLLGDTEPLVLAGRQQGYGPEFLAALSAESGIAFANTVLPPARVTAEMTQPGKALLALVTDQSETFTSQQRVALIINIDLLILPGKGRTQVKLTDFAGQKIGRVRGGCLALLRQQSVIDTYELNDFAQGLRMLQIGRLDGLCGNSTTLGWQLKKAGLKWRDFPPPILLSKQNLWLVASPAVPADTVQRLKAGVEAMARKGRIKALHDEYYIGSNDQ